jgi:hypothetical protein
MKRASMPTVVDETSAVDPTSPSMPIATLDDLDEITRWLGTFRVRLNAARETERGDVQTVLGE